MLCTVFVYLYNYGVLQGIHVACIYYNIQRVKKKKKQKLYVCFEAVKKRMLPFSYAEDIAKEGKGVYVYTMTTTTTITMMTADYPSPFWFFHLQNFICLQNILLLAYVLWSLYGFSRSRLCV